MALNNSNQGVTTNYVTLMDPLFEKFNISETVFKQFGDQFSTAYKMIRKMNAMKAVYQVKFYQKIVKIPYQLSQKVNSKTFLGVWMF
jgi:hypothetical protein